MALSISLWNYLLVFYNTSQHKYSLTLRICFQKNAHKTEQNGTKLSYSGAEAIHKGRERAWDPSSEILSFPMTEETNLNYYIVW